MSQISNDNRQTFWHRLVHRHFESWTIQIAIIIIALLTAIAVELGIIIDKLASVAPH